MTSRRGRLSPVIVPSHVDWDADYSQTTLGDLLAMSDEELAAVDPVAMNLIVGKGIPSLADLDIGHYQQIVNRWVSDLTRRCLPNWEPYFHQDPQDFENDIRFFQLGMICQYLEQEVGVEYNPDQRNVTSILYTNPSDLFLNGVLDTLRGTCGNLAALHVAMGWRLGLPVSLACVNSHYILRLDDGQVTYNIEATQSDYGGFKSDPDEYLIDHKQIPAIAVESGSDLRALCPREMLGAFIGLRARHFQDVAKREGDEEKMLASESQWLLARHLFPSNRALYKNQRLVTAMRGDRLFQPDELGHPSTYAGFLIASDALRSEWRRAKQQLGPESNGELIARGF